MILGLTFSSSANTSKIMIGRHILRRTNLRMLTNSIPPQQTYYFSAKNHNIINKSSNNSLTQCRHLSITNSKIENIDDNDDDGTIILYERDSSRNSLPRASFLVSSLNSIYWIW